MGALIVQLQQDIPGELVLNAKIPLLHRGCFHIAGDGVLVLGDDFLWVEALEQGVGRPKDGTDVQTGQIV